MRIIFHSIRGFIPCFFSIFPLLILNVGDFALFVVSVSFSISISIISSFSFFRSLINSIFGIFSFSNPLIFYFLFQI
ncbi:unnamed protein product [Meloidogyne enterolobii]|uniref:Uncharacterized protein n=2 Tax=Meloidogyne enterolobii TaxID=390850 RepID=A0ACB1AA53_MELEN|nr:unnamed protein product [Meloidogyne enterolobii]